MLAVMNLASEMMAAASSRPSFLIFQFLSSILDTRSEVILSLKESKIDWSINIKHGTDCFCFAERSSQKWLTAWRFEWIHSNNEYFSETGAEVRRLYLTGEEKASPDVCSGEEIHNVWCSGRLLLRLLPIVPVIIGPRLPGPTAGCGGRLALHLWGKTHSIYLFSQPAHWDFTALLQCIHNHTGSRAEISQMSSQFAHVTSVEIHAAQFSYLFIL